MTQYLVTKTVTEYHVFHIEAESADKARDLAEDDDLYYCDTDNAGDVMVRVDSVWEVVE